MINEGPPIIIDSSSLAHRAKHAVKDLSYDFIKTSVLFGFMNQLKKIADNLKNANFVFCFDSRENYRKKIFPEYKLRKRAKELTDYEKELNEATYRQINLLREEILPSLGFKNIFIQEGFEADDLIASICFCNEGHKIIVSSDEDLYQLLDTADMYKANGKLYSKQDLQEEFGITPKEWWRVKAIAGCNSDEVPGVPKVGEKTAIRYLKGTLKKDSVAYKNIEDSKKLLNRNVKLVKLPLKGTRKIKLDNSPENISLYEFRRFARMYNMQSLLNKTDQWVSSFWMV